MQEAELINRLITIVEDSPEKVVYLKGDKDAPYSSIMKMMDALRGAKIDSVALIADKPAGMTTGGGQ
jgi:biopolymer transport protein ExbD